MGRRKRRRATWRILSLMLGATLLLGGARSQDIAEALPPQNLADALETFAKVTGFQLAYRTELAADLKTPGAAGGLSTRDTLRQLLRGTGLTFAFVNDRTVAIFKVSDDLPVGGSKAAPQSSVSPPEGSNNTGSAEGAADNTNGKGSKNVAHRGLLVRLASALALVAGAFASAADGGDSTAAGAGPPKLEEIVVTARRREENLQTVPIAITVFSQQALDDNNIQTIGDLQYLVPSLSSNNALTRDAINVQIRGQGSNSVSAQPAVVAYLNEVPIPTDQDGNLAGGPGMLFDLENLQVLKGPQGTLFGRNSVGGDLLLQTARPTKEFGGSVQLTYGNYNDREASGAINLPIAGDILLTRFAFTGQLRDGFTQVQSEPGHTNGIDADNRDTWGMRETVVFRPSDVFQNDAIFTYSKFTSNGSPLLLSDINPTGLVPTFFPQIAALLAQQQALGARTALPISTDLISAGSLSAFDDIAKVSLTDNVAFRNIFGYTRTVQLLALDADGTALPIFDNPATPRNEAFRQYTEEAQLLGSSFAKRLDWILGAFYLNDENPDYVSSEATVFGAPQPVGLAHRKDTSKALFAQGSYDLSALAQGLKLTAGLRYTWDNRSLITGNAPDGPFTNLDAASGALTYTAGIDYQIEPSTLLYLSTSRGYRAGGANSPDPAGNPLPGYGPEFVKNVELGVKSDWEVAGMAVRTNADVFYQDYYDIQVQASSFDPNTDALTILTANAGAARLAGAELEATAQVTKNLQLGANYSYLNFSYSHFGSGVSDATAESLEQVRNGGNVPEKYGVSARYQLPVSSSIGYASMRANWNWQASSGNFFIPGGVIHSFGLLNLGADLNSIGGSNLDVSLFASNALNKLYTVTAYNDGFYPVLGYNLQRYGEPRFYGLRLRYRFGAEGNK
jgi:iron complex outermembrane recepter protein